MKRPGPLPAGLDVDGFTRADARRVGLSMERLRRSDLERPFHGVRSTTIDGSPIGLARRYTARLPDRGFFSHLTAAALWGLPLPRLKDPRIHVSRPHGERAIRTGGVIGHHLVISAAELTELDGMPVTTPERTWSDLAGWLRLEDLLAAGDRVIWRHAPLATAESLAAVARRHPGRRGRHDRLTALGLLSDRADSPPESILRCRIILAGLPVPEVNRPLRGPADEWIGQPDLTFAAFREVVEYEGDGHRTDVAQWRSDVARVPRFEDAGWHVNRATGDDLHDGSRRLLGILERRLREKGWSGATRY